MKSINRRNFIGITGAGTAALALNAAVPPTTASPAQTAENMKPHHTGAPDAHRTLILSLTE
ncbi:MAG: twin-arginine translocation signal domain-containing protein [Tannerella sp.]|nr:twin-arginine translocation signal domain-containing protein [Tannerella sp.]